MPLTERDLLDQALSAVGYGGSHLRLVPGDGDKIGGYLRSEQVRIAGVRAELDVEPAINGHRVQFLAGMFALWIAHAEGRDAPRAADRQRALQAAQAAADALAPPPDADVPLTLDVG